MIEKKVILMDGIILFGNFAVWTSSVSETSNDDDDVDCDEKYERIDDFVFDSSSSNLEKKNS